jgi:two-component system, NarL family, sensor kinase
MNNVDLILAIVISTLLILLLIAGLTISFFMAGRQRAKQQIELAQTHLTYEKELRQVETEVSEHLMQQFAQELHDNIGHILTCIRLEVENKKLDNPEVESLLAPTEKYLDEASQQLRLLSRSLNTDYIATHGLANAIHVEIERQQQLKKFHIHLDEVPGHTELDKNQELMAFRIFQEIVHNAMRHSRAKNLFVCLHCNPSFELTVRDDGKGFNWEETLKTPRASGLKNVLKRAAMADFNCQIASEIGKGCEYKLTKKEMTLIANEKYGT